MVIIYIYIYIYISYRYIYIYIYINYRERDKGNHSMGSSRVRGCRVPARVRIPASIQALGGFGFWGFQGLGEP